MISGDTIAAIASAVGPAARMIVRLSGPAALQIASELSKEDQHSGGSRAARAARCYISIPTSLPHAQLLRVPCQIYWFKGPASYTGEDVVECHIPGNPRLATLLLEELFRRGCRAAEPGEFTARAYFNGRMDLTRAEGVAATISAANEAELRAARQLLSGELARRLRPPMDLLAQTLGLVEVGIDFSEEDVTFITAAELGQKILEVKTHLADIVKCSARFERLAHEPRIVLLGRPNAGKSTLLNALAGFQRAIVSPIAGTTRDALSVEVPLARGMVQLIDVAGLEIIDLEDEVQMQMQQRALREAAAADLVVWVRDGSGAFPQDEPMMGVPDGRVDLTVLSKCDLLPDQPATGDEVRISALSGSGMRRLLDRLDQIAFGAAASSRSDLALNARHLAAIDAAVDCLGRAEKIAEAAGPPVAEIVAMELREALDALGMIIGAVSPDDIIGRIFGAFCIGK